MAELSERLKKLTEALRPLHLALTKETQVAYERQHGPVQGPGELLQLLIRHPDFAWLHPLSELMAVADELLDPRREVPVAPEEAAVAGNQRGWSGCCCRTRRSRRAIVTCCSRAPRPSWRTLPCGTP